MQVHPAAGQAAARPAGRRDGTAPADTGRDRRQDGAMSVAPSLLRLLAGLSEPSPGDGESEAARAVDSARMVRTEILVNPAVAMGAQGTPLRAAALLDVTA